MSTAEAGARDPLLPRVGGLTGVAAAIAVLIALCSYFPDGYVNFLIRLAGINIIAVCGLNLLMGYGGQAFIAVAATFAIGAYTSALAMMNLGLPLVLCLPLGGLLAAVFGLIVSLPALRLSGAYLAMVSIGFNVIVEESLVHWQGLTGGPVGLPGIPRGGFLSPQMSDQGMAILICTAAVLAWWIVDRMRHSQWGLAVIATRDSEIAARSLGVDTTRVKAVIFVVSTFLIGTAGALYSHSAQYVSPDVGGVFNSILFVLMLVLGGAGSRWGPVIGALLLTLLPLFLSDLQKYHLIVLGLILLACVVLMPKGIMSVIRSPKVITRPAARSSRDSMHTNLVAAGTETLARNRPALVVADLHRRFGGIAALGGVSLAVEAGTVRGLIGPNGSGKSTLINVVTGHYAASEGAVAFGEHRLTGLGMGAIARLGVVRTFQTPQLFGELSVSENIQVAQFARLKHPLIQSIVGSRGAVARSVKAEVRAEELAKAFDLGGVLNRPARELSQGQQRKLEIARALGSGPAVLVLDEPAAGLSNEEIRDLCLLLLQLKAQGLAILLIEHHMEVVMGVCDRITVIDRGEVLMEGSPLEVQASESVRRAYLGPFIDAAAKNTAT